MNYTLITTKGRIYTFYIEATALCYQQAYGGVVINNQILKTETDCATQD
jgi:type IV secretory pathway VirB9-like protein